MKDVYTSSGMAHAMLHPSHFPSQYCSGIPSSTLYDTNAHSDKNNSLNSSFVLYIEREEKEMEKIWNKKEGKIRNQL